MSDHHETVMSVRGEHSVPIAPITNRPTQRGPNGSCAYLNSASFSTFGISLRQGTDDGYDLANGQDCLRALSRV